MAQANRPAALARIRAAEGWTLRIATSELGGASWCGVTLGSWGEYCTAEGLPVPTLDEWKALAAQGNDVLSADQVNAFYAAKVLTPVSFDDLPSGVDYAVADYATNSGLGGALDAVRFLFGTPAPVAFWRMDDALMAALKAIPPALAVSAICDLRWARMQAASDFTAPSIVPGKILGDGRAFRMNSVRRGALELIGFPPTPDFYTRPPLAPPA